MEVVIIYISSNPDCKFVISWFKSNSSKNKQNLNLVIHELT